jgi:hypothetical protein
MRVAVICPYVVKSLITHVVSTFTAPDVALHLWAVEEVLPEVAQWTRGVGVKPKTHIWNTLIPLCEDADLVLFTDDDLEFPPGFLSRYLELVRGYGVDMSAPALTQDSSFTLIESIARDGLSARRVDWVDQMILGVSGRLVREAFPVPEWLGSTSWGVEHFFREPLTRHGWTCAIFDELQVKHTFRPIAASYSQLGAFATQLTVFFRHASFSLLRGLEVFEEYLLDGSSRPPTLQLPPDTEAIIDTVAPLMKQPLMLLMDRASRWPVPDGRQARFLDNVPAPSRPFLRTVLFVLARAQAEGRPGASEMVERLLSWPGSPGLNSQLLDLRRGVNDRYRERGLRLEQWHNEHRAGLIRASS